MMKAGHNTHIWLVRSCLGPLVICPVFRCSWITLMWVRRWKETIVPLRFGTNVRTLWGSTLSRPALLTSRTRGWGTSENYSSATACQHGVRGTRDTANIAHCYIMIRIIKYFSFLGPPDFDEILANCTAELGQTVKLACRVTGVPKPVVTWYKGDV